MKSRKSRRRRLSNVHAQVVLTDRTHSSVLFGRPLDTSSNGLDTGGNGFLKHGDDVHGIMLHALIDATTWDDEASIDSVSSFCGVNRELQKVCSGRPDLWKIFCIKAGFMPWGLHIMNTPGDVLHEFYPTVIAMPATYTDEDTPLVTKIRQSWVDYKGKTSDGQGKFKFDQHMRNCIKIIRPDESNNSDAPTNSSPAWANACPGIALRRLRAAFRHDNESAQSNGIAPDLYNYLFHVFCVPFVALAVSIERAERPLLPSVPIEQQKPVLDCLVEALFGWEKPQNEMSDPAKLYRSFQKAKDRAHKFNKRLKDPLNFNSLHANPLFGAFVYAKQLVVSRLGIDAILDACSYPLEQFEKGYRPVDGVATLLISHPELIVYFAAVSNPATYAFCAIAAVVGDVNAIRFVHYFPRELYSPEFIAEAAVGDQWKIAFYGVADRHPDWGKLWRKR